MPRRKIAFIHPDLGIGGAERLVLDVAAALAKQSNDVIFLTNHFDQSHTFEDLKKSQFSVQVFGDWLPRSVFGRFQALCAYIRMVYLTFIYCIFYRRGQRPDLYFVDLIPAAIPILKLFGEKAIYYCHHPDLLASEPGGTLKRAYRKPIDWLEEQCTGQADILLVNSEYTATVFCETFPEIKKPMQVVYPTVACSFQEAVTKLKKNRNLQELIPEIPSSANCVFLSINRYHPAKKLELAVLAMGDLHTTLPEDQWKGIFLIIAGGYDPQSKLNASCFAELAKLTSDKGLTDKIVFLKSPSDDLKVELLSACDCVIYTPVKEHFGIVPLEAMAVAKPVIACDSGGPRETVEHGTTGFLCQPTSDSLALFMTRILDANRAKELGANGKKIFEEKFSQASFADNLNIIVASVNKKYV